MRRREQALIRRQEQAMMQRREQAMTSRKEQRRRALCVRDAMPEGERRVCSGEIQRRICEMEWYREARCVLSYASFRSEVSTEQINRRALEDGKVLYLPKTWADKGYMEFYRVGAPEELSAGYQGIPEPPVGESFPDFIAAESGGEDCVLMLMPGAAFDGENNRLGYGGGYYDKYLAQRGEAVAHTVMLAYDAQRVEKIEAERHDVRPDRIVTENGCQCRAGE